MDISDNFDLHKNSYMITIDRYKSRFDFAVNAFEHFGLCKPKLLPGFDKENPAFHFLSKPPFSQFTQCPIIPNVASIKCQDYTLLLMLGHLSAVMMARALNLDYIIIFEDDAYPRKDICEKLKYYLKDIPDDCGILQIGFLHENIASIFFKNYNEKYCEAVRLNGRGTQSYILFKQAYDDYIRLAFQVRNSDLLMTSLWFNNKYKVYVTKENLFIQAIKTDAPYELDQMHKYGDYQVALHNNKLLDNGTFVFL